MTEDPDWITAVDALAYVRAAGIDLQALTQTLRKWASHGEVRTVARSVYIRYIESTRKEVMLPTVFWVESDQAPRFQKLEKFSAGTFVSVLEIEHEGEMMALEAEAIGVRFSLRDLKAIMGCGSPVSTAAVGAGDETAARAMENDAPRHREDNSDDTEIDQQPKRRGRTHNSHGGVIAALTLRLVAMTDAEFNAISTPAKNFYATVSKEYADQGVPPPTGEGLIKITAGLLRVVRKARDSDV